jgi:signal transduction histidine kinase
MEADYKRILEDFNQQIETLVAERTMSLMSLTVADKIRNPSCVIKGLCNRILKMDEVGGKTKEELRMISQEADKLEKIVVEFQNLFMEKRSLFTHEDLNLVVMDIISIIKKNCAHQEINLHIDLASNSLKMNMQKNLFRAAVFHVLKNAVEATPQGGRIIVATEAGSDSVELRISNSGPGISPQDLPKIFDPFFSTKKQRFGMGLSLVKQIISEHLGRISVSSEPLNGTTFTLTFPVNWFGKGEVKPA